MSWYDGLAGVVAGPLGYAASKVIGGDADGVKELLLGGGATKGIDTKPQHYDQATGQLGQIATAAGHRAAPTAYSAQVGPAAQLASGPADQARAGMMGVAGRLGGIAAGTQMGAGEMAVNRQVGAATAAQMAAARMSRGANSALAYRTAARNSADIGLGGAAAAGQAQMQDQQGANAQLGQLYGGMRGQDIDMAGQNAQLGQQAMIQQAQMGQQTALANLQAQLAQTGMNDQQQIAAMGQMLGWDQATINAQLQRAAIAAGDKGMLPSLIQAGGTALAASDERLKTDIADAGDDADALMASLRPKSYRYLDGRKWGEGNRLGIMAQDLAKSKMGSATLVKVDDKHLGFDVAKATSATLASVARLHERLSRLEGKGA